MRWSARSRVVDRVSPAVSTLVLWGVGLLAVLTPFGRESTGPGMFALYRFLLLGVGVLCVWYCRGRRGPEFGRWAYTAISTTLGLMFLSVWWNAAWEPAARTAWYGYALLAFFFVALARFGAIQSSRWKHQVLGILIGSALIHLMLEQAGVTATFETFVNRNYLATFLLIGFACAVAFTMFSLRPVWKLSGALAAAVLLIGVTGTSSRGATLAAMGVVGIALLKAAKPKVVLIVGAATIFVIAAGAASSPELVRKFTDLGEFDPYNYDRVGIWTGTLEMVGQEPLLGVGLSHFGDRARRFRFAVEGTIGRYMMRINIAHSEYLQLAAEAGLPVAMLAVGLIGVFLTGLFRQPASPADPGATPEMAAMLVGVGVGLHAIVDNVWTVPVAVATMTALALASSRLKAAREARPPAGGRVPVYAGIALVAVFIGSSVVPAAAYYSHNRALDYSSISEPDSAVAAQRWAVTLWPNDATMLTNLGVYHLDLASLGNDPRQLDMAAAYFVRAIDANPEYLEAREGYANTILRRLSGDPARDRAIHLQLIRAYEGILELDPHMPFIERNLAEAYYWTDQKPRASEVLEDAIRMEPNYVEGYLRLAELRESDGRSDDARELRAQAARIVATYAGQQSLTEYERRLLGRTSPQVSP